MMYSMLYTFSVRNMLLLLYQGYCGAYDEVNPAVTHFWPYHYEEGDVSTTKNVMF